MFQVEQPEKKEVIVRFGKLLITMGKSRTLKHIKVRLLLSHRLQLQCIAQTPSIVIK